MRHTSPLSEPHIALTPPPTNTQATRERQPYDVKAFLTKQALTLLIPIVIVGLLWTKIAPLNFAAIFATVENVTPRQWMLALLTTAGSFWAVGRYDILLHAQFGTGVSENTARTSGIAAIGLAQFIGFGAITGTLVRWRLIPELSLWQAARLSAAIALSFIAGWAVVTSLAIVLLQPEVPWMKTLASIALFLAASMALLSVYPPAALVRLPWPTLRTIVSVVCLAAIDTLLAGATLYILLPADVLANIGQVISAYLFALGVGLIGATPGGIGPFEAILASLLPLISLERLLGAVLAYRIVYYVIPASLAALLVLRGPRNHRPRQKAQLIKTSASPYLPPNIERQVFTAPRAEANLLRTRDFSLLTNKAGEHIALAAPIGQSLVMLSDPITSKTNYADARSALQEAAQARYRMPALYKCSARMAACARKDGWSVLPTAQEAYLDPKNFTLQGAQYRQLRRHLKKATAANVTVCEAGLILPLAQMDDVAHAWAQQRGQERGFSMGTYNRKYVACQRVFLAYKDSQLIAFITLHQARSELTLDLMRHTDDAPDGTLHLLLSSAIQSAAQTHCPRVSLAAVPWVGAEKGIIVPYIRKTLLKRSNHAGLARFKTSFNPHWETLYIAGPSRTALAVAAIDVIRRITAPPRTPPENDEARMKKHPHPTHRTLRFLKSNRR
jgi:phosphatidylglycerol lysyltransferase